MADIYQQIGFLFNKKKMSGRNKLVAFVFLFMYFPN